MPPGRSQRETSQQLPSLERRPTQQLNELSGKQDSEREYAPQLEIGQLRRLNELLLRFLPTGVVVIDRSYHVLTANSTARRLLGLRETGIEQDFLHAVRGIPYTSARNAIDTVFRERKSLTLPEVTLNQSMAGNNRTVSLAIVLMQQEAGTPDLVVMSIIDITEQIQIQKQLETAQTEQSQLMQELSAKNARLDDTNKALLDANEELQVSNEELMLAHEELQATIEEFETTNEELQATNEELETSNEELQATNEELETTNDELRARSGELQEMTNMLENERIRLLEMVELAPFTVLVLRGPRLLVEAFPPHFESIGEGGEVQNRPIDEVFDRFWQDGAPLVRLIHEVYSQNVTRTRAMVVSHATEDGATDVRTVVYTLVPSHEASGRVSGVLIYAVDETERLLKEAHVEGERLRILFEHTQEAGLALYDAQSGALLMGSPRYLEMVTHIHGLKRSEVQGRHFHKVSLVVSEEEAQEIWKSVLENKAPRHWSGIHIKLAEDEPETVWDWTLTPITRNEEPDTIEYMLVSAIEITEQAQERAKAEELNRLKDEFLSLTSFELRTPLTSILGNAELLQRQAKVTDTSSQEIQAVERIVSQAKRLNRLIDQMLDATRIQGEVPELHNEVDVDLVEVTRRAIDSYSLVGREIILEVDSDALVGNWDEARLEQVLHNLLSNALTYSPEDTSVNIRLAHQGNEAVVSIQDQGPGLTTEEQAHIFDRFYRVSRDEKSNVEGVGLGLYIAQQIITRSGGHLWVWSKKGDGSTFSFALPLKKTHSRQRIKKADKEL
jgi:two-component system, chemotaxis family, CheB/CheR fusion protein